MKVWLWSERRQCVLTIGTVLVHNVIQLIEPDRPQKFSLKEAGGPGGDQKRLSSTMLPTLHCSDLISFIQELFHASLLYFPPGELETDLDCEKLCLCF